MLAGPQGRARTSPWSRQNQASGEAAHARQPSASRRGLGGGAQAQCVLGEPALADAVGPQPPHQPASSSA